VARFRKLPLEVSLHPRMAINFFTDSILGGNS
jgi:hypothetical protein